MSVYVFQRVLLLFLPPAIPYEGSTCGTVMPPSSISTAAYSGQWDTSSGGELTFHVAQPASNIGSIQYEYVLVFSDGFPLTPTAFASVFSSTVNTNAAGSASTQLVISGSTMGNYVKDLGDVGLAVEVRTVVGGSDTSSWVRSTTVNYDNKCVNGPTLCKHGACNPADMDSDSDSNGVSCVCGTTGFTGNLCHIPADPSSVTWNPPNSNVEYNSGVSHTINVEIPGADSAWYIFWVRVCVCVRVCVYVSELSQYHALMFYVCLYLFVRVATA
jgi:hypothetical protein